ncbi:MAG TPA: hypothetical protein VGF63_02900 [Solirubrobacteraceae bacterium]|jgi:hypothetical protein
MQGGLGTIVYVVIGAFVAASDHYFAHVGSVARVASAVVAILLWPAILLGVHIHIS